MNENFEPKIIAFACNWCSYPAADSAGSGRMQYSPDIRIVRVMCSGRLDPSFVLKAFEHGADGVLITGCHVEDCHYLFGAKQMTETYETIERLVHLLGIEPERLRYEQIAASEAPKFARVVNEFVDNVKKVGPNQLRGNGELRRAISGTSATEEPK